MAFSKSRGSASIRAIVLVDGEHYPPVVADAIAEVRKEAEVLAAVFIGGMEKISGIPGEELWGVPVIAGADAVSSLREALSIFKPDTVIDLSDEPVIGYRERFTLANVALVSGASYRGSDFIFDVPELPVVAQKPSIRVIGTGKRVGKTAVSAFLARELKNAGRSPIVIAMGRGGPPEPEVLLGSEVELSAETLMALADAGKHAASDYIEDALMSRVTTVGCRRCGGGLAGAPMVSNVVEGCRVANGLEGDIIVLEGSGSSLPPVAADASLVTIAAGQPLDYISGYFGPYRLLTSEVAVLTNCDNPNLSAAELDRIDMAIRSVNPAIKLIQTVFRLSPLSDISGEKVFLATTAPPHALSAIQSHLEVNFNCTVTHASHSLSNRPALRAELEHNRGKYSVIVTELKAAAVDVATRAGIDAGVPVIYADNVPETVGGDGELARVLSALAVAAFDRFANRHSQENPSR